MRSDRIRRQSNRPATNSSSSGPKIHGSLISRPNAPFEPRAIDHATCGPVHADVMVPVLSFTITRATSAPSAHQCRTQAPLSNEVDDVTLALASAYRAIQSRTFGEVPAIVSARFFVSRCVSRAPGFTLVAVTTLSESRTVIVARIERDGSASRAIQVCDAAR